MKTNLPLRLSNPHAKAPRHEPLHTRVDKTQHDYFFYGCVAGEHGACQSIIAHLFDKFYHYVHDVLKLPSAWDITHAPKLAEILQRTNFEDTEELLRAARMDQASQISNLTNELQSLRSRCSDPSPTIPTRKPASPKRDPSRTRSNSPPMPANGSKPKGPKRSGKSQAKSEAQSGEDSSSVA